MEAAMTNLTTSHAWMTRAALRISASSGLPFLEPPKAAPCVLDLLDRTRPQSQVAMRLVIA
jgi:hypothetical protein